VKQNPQLPVQAAGAGDDAVLPATRWLAIVVIPFLVVAAGLLFIWPNDTDKTFAWTIKPAMTPMMLAAAYMGGIVFFAQVARARQWHTVKVGFLPVLAFASLLGAATLLHWERFNHAHISFWAWAGLYFTTPFLVLAAWLLNCSLDPQRPAPGEAQIAFPVRVIMGLFGALTLPVSLFLFFSPALTAALWPWALTPLTARVVGAMFALPGLVGLGIAFDARWSAARVILQAQAFSILIILLAALRAWGDFNPGSAGTYLFLGGLVAMLLTIAGFYVFMETRQPGKAQR